MTASTKQNDASSEATETHSFQAEVSRLLDIVAHSLYSEREVFLRELISNAADACDRLRYLAITDQSLLGQETELQIHVTIDKGQQQLTIADNGIGMGRDELIDNLGTIARSGSGAFMKEVAGKADDKDAAVNLIGQFGVGFYSAFMVASEVAVVSRRAGSDEVWRWVSDGRGEYTTEALTGKEATDTPRGTRITLTLREDAEEFAEDARIREIIHKYSDHIALPIRLGMAKDGATPEEVETVNKASALWTRPKSEISDTDYVEFYRHVSHAFDEPWMRLHYKAEGMIEYDALVFVPTARPHDLFDPAREQRVKLFVKRVFITDNCEGLVAPYLRFTRGIVDSADLPLNVSREMLQTNPLVKRIRNGLTKRILSELAKKAEKEPEEYAKFWEQFGAVLKEGLYEDAEYRDEIMKTVRFRSSTRDGLISIQDYIDAMKPGQDHIFYIGGDDDDALRRSPQLEGFNAKGVEVLLMTDPIDEFWIPTVIQYQDKAFKSVTRAGADLDQINAEKKEGEAEKPAEETKTDGAVDLLAATLKVALGEAVKDVRASKRLTDSPVCLVSDDGDLDLNIARMLKANNQLNQNPLRVLEVNPDHALIKKLVEQAQAAGDDAANALNDAAHLLLDQARILEGETIPDPAAFASRFSRVMERGL
ncbi:MAG: molecular chaperone HtpG [Alphaproteobacteria bacterium]|nr:molecular chaperone HtpG [Alphaproteobacteria bacterium SS10]